MVPWASPCMGLHLPGHTRSISPAGTPSLHLTCPDTLAPSHLPGHPRSISPAGTPSLHLTCPDTLAPSHLPGHPRSISPAGTPSLHLTCPDTLAPSHLPGHPRSISPARTPSAPSHLPGHPRSISPARTPSLHLTCPDILTPSHLRSTAAEAGSAAKEAEERKVSKYRSIAAYHTFIPVAVETLGPMGPEAKSFLLDLGRRLRQHTGEPRSTSYLIYTAAGSQWRSRRAMLLPLPHGKELDELLQL